MKNMRIKLRDQLAGMDLEPPVISQEELFANVEINEKKDTKKSQFREDSPIL